MKASVSGKSKGLQENAPFAITVVEIASKTSAGLGAGKPQEIEIKVREDFSLCTYVYHGVSLVTVELSNQPLFGHCCSHYFVLFVY